MRLKCSGIPSNCLWGLSELFGELVVWPNCSICLNHSWPTSLMAVHIRTHELNVVPFFMKFGGPKKGEGILTPEGSCDSIYTDNLYAKSIVINFPKTFCLWQNSLAKVSHVSQY